MNDDIEIGVLGAGHIGKVHIQSARAMDGVTVAAAADKIAENRRYAAEIGARRTYEDYTVLLETEDVDVTVVALPPFLHASATEKAAEQGSHVFIEKPLARTTDEAREMLSTAESANVTVGVDHTLRYHPEMRTLKERYDHGKLGRVPLCFVSRVNNGPFESPPPTESVPDWQLEPELTGGGALIDLGVHLFDLLEWFFGSMEVRHAELDRQLDIDYEDTAAVTLRSNQTGTTASLHCGFYQWEEPPEVNLNFRLDGIAETDESSSFVPNLYANAGRSALANVAKRLTGNDPDYYGPSYYYRAHFDALSDFVTAVRNGTDPPVGGHEGIRALELVEQAYERASDDGADVYDSVEAAGGVQ